MLSDTQTMVPGSKTINTPYDIAAPVYGKPAVSEVVLRINVQRAFKFESISGKAGTAASGSNAVFVVAKNGSQIGTLTFATGNATATSTVPATNFAENDLLTVTAPSSQNAALADIDLFVKGSLL